MTWKQIGVAVGAAGVLVTAWLGIWGMVDRRFAELGARIDGVRNALHDDNTALRDELREVAAAVNVLVGRQQERDSTAD